MSGLKAARRDFVEEIRSRGKISSPQVLRAFATTPREPFFGEGPWRVRGAIRKYCTTVNADPIHLYQDVLVAIDAKRRLDSGLPSLWARLFDIVGIRGSERVVQVGCGTGYFSVILSKLVGPRGTVVAIDCDEAFIQRARQNLHGLRNVRVLCRDGCRDVGGTADVIIVHAGFTYPHPLWLDSLRPNGRLIVPLTGPSRQGTLFKITRLTSGYQAKAVGGIEIYSGYGRSNMAVVDKRLERWWEAMFSVRSLRRDPHVKDRTCWLHRKNSCLSTLVPETSA